MKLYLKYAEIQLKTMLEYKLSFFISTVTQFLTAFASILTLTFIMDRFGSIGDFTLEQVMICCSVSTFSFALTRCFFDGFSKFSGVVRNGQLDSILIRPKNTVFMLISSNIRFERLGSALSSLLILIYAVSVTDIWHYPARLLTLGFMVLGGAAFFAGVYMLYAALCFFTLEGLEFINVFTNGVTELGRYPIGVYGKAILSFFTAVLPFACAQYYPFLYVCGIDERWFLALTPGACFLFLVPCFAFWRFGLSKYQSSGS